MKPTTEIETRPCVVCGKEITQRGSRWRAKPSATTCSRTCSARRNSSRRVEETARSFSSLDAMYEARFWSRVKKTAGCWEWLGQKSKAGYGLFSVGKHKIRAHRFSYKCIFGDLTKGMDVHHQCGNPGCVRPDHLKECTRRTHMLEDGRLEKLAATNLVAQPPLPCDHCGRHSKPRRKGLCGACYDYQRRTGNVRPIYLEVVKSEEQTTPTSPVSFGAITGFSAPLEE